MSTLAAPRLIQQGIELYKCFLDRAGNGREITQDVLGSWQAYEKSILLSFEAGLLDAASLSKIAAVVRNVSGIAISLVQTRQDFDSEIDMLKQQIEAVTLTNDNSESTTIHRRPSFDD